MKKTALKVFLDCDDCDLEYIKTEITFVNYVRDRLEAQVHVLISTQGTGGGGVEYTLTFIGQNDFKDAKDLQKYYSNKTDTDDDVRRGLVKALKLGLMSFVGRTPIARRIAVEYTPPQGPAAGPGPLELLGLQPVRERLPLGRGELLRATWPTALSRPTGSRRDRRSGSACPSTARSRNTSSTRRRSPGPRRAGRPAASTSRAWASTGRSASPSTPNPPSSATSTSGWRSLRPWNTISSPTPNRTRRQLRALYSLALNPVRYREETIFGKLRETLFKQELSLTLDLREKFGTISLSAEGSNYLHDLGKYRIDTFGIVNLRLYKGLSVYVLGGYSWYHDSQLSLLGREPTYEEQLLRLRELPMTSNHFFAVGFQFQFGSIFTNVINPRFGSTGGGGMSISIH